MTDDDTVRYNVQMPQDLRTDAKRNTERGELAEDVRDLFRRKAYGVGASEQPTELEQKRQELQEARNQIDTLRLKRDQLDAKISSKETRAARLEESISELEQQADEESQTITVLERLLQNGERMFLGRIKGAADVDAETARRLQTQLQERNPDVPAEAFTAADKHTDADWQRATAYTG